MITNGTLGRLEASVRGATTWQVVVQADDLRIAVRELRAARIKSDKLDNLEYALRTIGEALRDDR